MAVIETSGIGDRTLYSQVMANIRGAYSSYGVGNGGYPNVQDILTDRLLDSIWMRNNLNARIFVDGKGITSRTAQAQGVSSVRVPLMAPPPYLPRTLATSPYTGVSLPGTPGNDGLENRNLPNLPQTMGVDVYFNQVYDHATVIPKLSQNMLSLPLAAQYTAQIPEAVANMEDTTIMATQIGTALKRAYDTTNANVVDVDLTNTNDGYLQGIMNSLISKMTNPQTAWSEGMVQYDLEDCVIVMKQSFFNLLFSVKNGVLVNGGNLPQEMLVRGAFTEDGRPKGNLIRGMYSGVYIKVIPDSYWNQAAAYLGITAAQYTEFSKIQAYIASGVGTAFGRADTSINTIPNPGTSIGTKIQNLWQWGVSVVRPSSIGLVISGLSGFTNPMTSDPSVIAPADMNEVISGYSVSADYGTANKVGVYNGDLCHYKLTVTDSEASPAAITGAALSIITADKMSVGYVEEGSGVYSFDLKRGTAATVTITKTGFTKGTVTIAATDTTGATASSTKQMTAAAS